MDVVEQQHERLRRGEPLEQLAHRRGGRGSARPGAPASARLGVFDERRQHARQLARTASSIDSRRRGSSAATYSSSASTKTQNGRSRSSSMRSRRARCWPRASARVPSSPAAASCRSRARPGSPAAAAPVAEPPRARSSDCDFVGASDELLGDGGHAPSPEGEHNRGRARTRVAIRGGTRQCEGGGPLGASPHESRTPHPALRPSLAGAHRARDEPADRLTIDNTILNVGAADDPRPSSTPRRASCSGSSTVICSCSPACC